MLASQAANSEEVLAKQCDEFEARLKATLGGKTRIAVQCLVPAEEGGSPSRTQVRLCPRPHSHYRLVL